MSALIEAPVPQDDLDLASDKVAAQEASNSPVASEPWRTVHGLTRDGLEVLRDRWAHYSTFDPRNGKRRRVGLMDAALLIADGGEWFAGRDHGEVLDAAVWKLLASRTSSTSSDGEAAKGQGSLALVDEPTDLLGLLAEREEPLAESEVSDDDKGTQQAASPDEDEAAAPVQDCEVYASGGQVQVTLPGADQGVPAAVMTDAPAVTVDIKGKRVRIDISISLRLQ